MIHKILFAGIDGSGKSTCLDLLISRLESKYSIIKIGEYRCTKTGLWNNDPHIFFKGQRKLYITNRSSTIMGYIRPVSKRYHFYGIFLIANFVYKYLLAKYVEICQKCDLLMYETDILLHPAVYITYHFPFSRKITNSLRFKVVKILFGSQRNCSIFYLDTEPAAAMERIHKRGADVHEHENPRDLHELKKEFDNMVEVARKGGFRIFRINTNDKAVDEVVDDVEVILEKELSRGDQ